MVGDSVTLIKPVLNNKKYKSSKETSNLHRYFRSNLKLRLPSKNAKGKKQKQYEGNIELSDNQSLKKEIEIVTHHIIKQFKELLPDNKIVFTMDAPRQLIYQDKLKESKVYWMNELVAEACALQEIDFIDMTPMFQKDYRKNKQKFEFFYDGHWNAYAHKLVANILHDYFTNGNE